MKTLFYNAKVYTGELPLKEAFIIEGDKFTFVGTNEEALNQAFDEKVDLEGKFVCPGFIDSHMHVLNFGQALSCADLTAHTE
ncbi:MAG: amidohydrolase family protein, partial [Clostridia bacterium]|nr:amidohydrolase family protein [Clostridia bacterium]